jgi:hypothetical protein
MATVIILHVLSSPRFLGRPRLLTRIARLPVGRHSSSVPQVISRNPIHIRRTIPMDHIARTEDPLCMHIALTSQPSTGQADAPGGIVPCCSVGHPGGLRARSGDPLPGPGEALSL